MRLPIVDLYIAHNRKASNALCTLVEREKKSFQVPAKTVERNVTDLAGSLVTNSRPPGRLQKMPDDRTWKACVAVRTADGSRRTGLQYESQWRIQECEWGGLRPLPPPSVSLPLAPSLPLLTAVRGYNPRNFF